MAASLRKVGRLFFQDKQMINTMFVRNNRYDTTFLENTRTIESIKEPLAEDDERRFRRIKAARTDDNTFTDFDPLVQKFTNMVLKNGRKLVARDEVAMALENVKRVQVEKYHKADEATKPTIELNPVNILHQAIENGKPSLIIMAKVVAGERYQVPVAPSEKKQYFLSMKWLILAGKEKQKTERFHDQLGKEILNAYHNKGGLIKRKQEMHKNCEANKAYAHFANM